MRHYGLLYRLPTTPGTPLRQRIQAFSSKAGATNVDKRVIFKAFDRGNRHVHNELYNGFEIQVLGSGAKMPTARSSCPCFGFRGSGAQNDGVQWLFDCGEGAQRQMTQSIFRAGKIDCVFITHLHGDHIFGEQSAVRRPPLNIYGPPGLYNYICMTLKICDPKFPAKENNKPNVIVHELTCPEERGYNPLLQGPLKQCRFPGVEYAAIPRNSEGLWEVKRQAPYTVTAGRIEHVVPTFGYVIQEDDLPGKLDAARVKAMGLRPGPQYQHLVRGRDVILPDGGVIKSAEVMSPSMPGRKATILGDTCNPYSLLKLAMDSDVLIHEATLDDTHMARAKSRGHSTPSMAAAFARDCRARLLVLTHFSARYWAPRCEGNLLNIMDLPIEETLAIELVEQAVQVLGPDRVIPAEDLLALTVPKGGYEPVQDLVKSGGGGGGADDEQQEPPHPTAAAV